MTIYTQTADGSFGLTAQAHLFVEAERLRHILAAWPLGEHSSASVFWRRVCVMMVRVLFFRSVCFLTYLSERLGGLRGFQPHGGLPNYHSPGHLQRLWAVCAAGAHFSTSTQQVENYPQPSLPGGFKQGLI